MFSNPTKKRCQTQIPRQKVELINPVRLGTEQSPPFFSFLPNSPTRNPCRRFFFLAQRRRPDAAAPSSTSSPAPPLIVAYSATILSFSRPHGPSPGEIRRGTTGSASVRRGTTGSASIRRYTTGSSYVRSRQQLLRPVSTWSLVRSLHCKICSMYM